MSNRSRVNRFDNNGNDDDYDRREREISTKVSGFGVPLIIGIGVVAGIAGVARFTTGRYIRCPPNKLMVVYGSGKEVKYVHGGGCYVWPVYQSYKLLSLSPIQIPIILENTLSLRKVRVNIPSVFTVAIGRTDEMKENAANRLLDMEMDEIKLQAAEIIFGQFRDVVASMEIESINADRASFSKKVNDNVGTELAKYGLELVNVNFKDITDESGVIKAMGEQAAAEAINRAKVDVANQRKFGDVGEAKERLARDTEVARLEKEREVTIAQEQIEKEMSFQNQQKLKNVRLNMEQAEESKTIQKQDTERDIEVNRLRNQQELTIRQQQAQKSVEFNKAVMEEEAKIKQAQAEREVQINKTHNEQLAKIRKQEAERDVAMNEALVEETVRKTQLQNEQRVKISESNASATQSENENRAKIAQLNADLAKAESIAHQESEIAKRSADSKIEELSHIYKKKIAEARGEQLKAEKYANVIVEAEVERQRRIIMAEAVKEQELLELHSNANAILEMELARAKGRSAHLQAEANYIKEVVASCGGADGATKYRLVDKVPEMAKYSAEALQNIKFDKVVVWDGGDRRNGEQNSTANFVTNLVGSVAPIGDIVKNVLGVDMREYLGSAVSKKSEGEPLKSETPKENILNDLGEMSLESIDEIIKDKKIDKQPEL